MSLRDRLEEIISEATHLLTYSDEILLTDDNELDRACDILSDLREAIDERLDTRTKDQRVADMHRRIAELKAELRAQGVDPDKLVSDAGFEV